MFTFKEESTDIMIGIRDLHDNIIFYLIMIFIFVFYLMIYILFNKNEHKSIDMNHNNLLEFIWTITPGIILILIGIPSFKLLYNMNEVLNPVITLKIIGSQWYWNYSILNYNFSSYMNEEYKLFKFLETDNPLYLPLLTPIRIIITSTDVIHSWAVPSFGIKVDSIPGRLNQSLLYILKPGIYFGQCSELCGLGHAYMPIEIHAVDNYNFYYWYNNQNS